MKLFVPSVGDRLVLTAPWEFNLYHERRNFSMMEHLGIQFNHDYWRTKMTPRPVTMGRGTLLEVDRVYIRTQSKQAGSTEDDYDSLTFRVLDPKTGKGKARFWAKLADVNTIEFEFPSEEQLTAGDDAKDKAKQAREELAWAKGYVAALCGWGGKGTPEARAHVDVLVSTVNNVIKDTYWDREKIQRYVLGRESSWTVKSKRLPDGKMERQFTFVWRDRKFNGFTLVSDGTEVISCEPLT